MQFIITVPWLVTFFTGANNAKPKRLFNFHVPRLNDAESGALLPAQGSKTKVGSCSVSLGTLSPEGFAAPHGSVNRLSSHRAGVVPAPSPASPSN